MKKLLLCFALFFLCVSARAQVSYSTISGTVTDANSNPLANATITATLVTSAGFPVSSATTPNGQPFNGSPAYGTLDSSGHFSINLVPNATLSRPSNSQWKITIGAPQDSAILTFGPSWTVNYQFTVTGNQDLSTQLSALVTSPVAFFNTKTGQSTLRATGSTPAGPAFAVQIANSSVTAPQADPTVTINPTTHQFTASVNSRINVMTYGAKGDCTTDDTPAFAAAVTQALAVSGSQQPAPLFTPKPPGGCYIVSNLQFKGVSIEGPPCSLGPASPVSDCVRLKSLPGQDVLHVPDPTTTSGTIPVNAGWVIRNIALEVDNSVAGNFPHRWPGKWVDDGAMTASSTSFSSPNAKITCGDIGEPIRVAGAGPAGADLITTIASITPCWASSISPSGWNFVTLAAAASTTVTNAHTYISVKGIPVTQNVGNCGLAFDLQDGNQADWAGSYSGGNYGRLENVVFRTSNGLSTNWPCAIYVQGWPFLYGLRAEQLGFYSIKFGIIQGTTELNSFDQPGSGDFEVWEQGIFFFVGYPYIGYNGFNNNLLHMQYTTQAGIEIGQYNNAQFDQPEGGVYAIGGEAAGTPTAYGAHITGGDNVLNGDLNTVGTIEIGYLDCFQCTVNGTVATNSFVNGAANVIISPNKTTGAVDSGLGNQIKFAYSGNGAPGNMGPNYFATGTFFKGAYNLAGRFTPDFMADGNYQTPYNLDDLLITPHDVAVGNGAIPEPYPYETYVGVDSTSPTGSYLNLTGASPTAYYTDFNQYHMLNGGGPAGAGAIKVGVQLPTSGMDVYYAAKCPTGSTFGFYIAASTVVNSSPSCSTSWQLYHTSITWGTGDVGQQFRFGGQSGTNPFEVAYVMLRPFRADTAGVPNAAGQVPVSVAYPNGGAGFKSTKAIAGSGAALPSGPSSGTTTGHGVCYADTSGTQQDCGAAPFVPVADVTVTVPALTVPANTCWGASSTTTPTTFTMTGVTTSMKISPGDTGNPSAIAGWGASGGLGIRVWPSASNQGSYLVCNDSAASITGSSIVFVMGAQ